MSGEEERFFGLIEIAERQQAQVAVALAALATENALNALEIYRANLSLSQTHRQILKTQNVFRLGREQEII
jgi:RNA-binding protein YlmH